MKRILEVIKAKPIRSVAILLFLGFVLFSILPNSKKNQASKKKEIDRNISEQNQSEIVKSLNVDHAKTQQVDQPAGSEDVVKTSGIKFETYEDMERYMMVAFPVFQTTDNFAAFLQKLYFDGWLEAALKNFGGYGYVSFKSKNFADFASYTEVVLFNNLPVLASNPEFWRQMSGDGKLRLINDSWSVKMTAELERQGLSKYLKAHSKREVWLQLSQLGEFVPYAEAEKLSSFLAEFASEFAEADYKLSGRLDMSFDAIGQIFADNINYLIQSLIGDEKIREFIAGMDINGGFLVGYEYYFVLAKNYFQYVDEQFLAQTAFPISYQNEQYHFNFDIPEKISPQQVNQGIAQAATYVPEISERFTWIGTIKLPISIRGSQILRYYRTLINLYQNFDEQTVFPPDTTVQAYMIASFKDFASASPTYWSGLEMLGVNHFIYRSLDTIDGDVDFHVPVSFNLDDFNSFGEFLSALNEYGQSVEYNQNFNNFILRIPIALAENEAFKALKEEYEKKDLVFQETQEDFEISYNPGTFFTVVSFTKLVDDLSQFQGAGISFSGKVELSAKDLHSNVQARNLVHFLNEEAKVLNLVKLLEYAVGDGKIYLFPHPERYSKYDNLRKIYHLLKANPKAVKTWSKLQGEFIYKIPYDASKPAEPGTWRYVYEYLQADGDKKLRKKRITLIKDFLARNSSRSYNIPRDLAEILDLVSDKRLISEVLKEKDDDTF